MATRRVRRDSETSTDSWSLVEEDHLEDDISVHSTEEEEGDENQEEPIIEEPPTSDEDTASENSDCSDSDSDCDSDSDDTDSDSDCQSEKSAFDVNEEDVSEDEEEEEESDLEIQEEEGLEEEEEEIELTEEQKKAVRKCKEEDWSDDEEEDQEDQEDGEVPDFKPIPFVIALAFLFAFFVAADRYTAYLIDQLQIHDPDSSSAFFYDGYSQQRYDSNRVGRYGVEVAKKEEKDDHWRPQYKTLKQKLEKLSILEDYGKIKIDRKNQKVIYNTNLSDDVRAIYETIVPELFEVPFEHSDSPLDYPVDPYEEEEEEGLPSNSTITLPECSYETSPLLEPSSSSLAPIPPAPFTPRRQQKKWIPRHQPCLVHVNESKWTCQKNVPAVIYAHSHTHLVKKWKKSGRTGGDYKQRKAGKKHEICGKKASQSMRVVSKQTDQCESRHFSKYTPRRKHIAYKAPLPCKAPNYKPSHPKPSRKPSHFGASDDWLSKRGHLRAQLRSRA